MSRRPDDIFLQIVDDVPPATEPAAPSSDDPFLQVIDDIPDAPPFAPNPDRPDAPFDVRAGLDMRDPAYAAVAQDAAARGAYPQRPRVQPPSPAEEEAKSTWQQAAKTGAAAVGQATLGLSRALFDTPGAAARYSRGAENALRDLGVPDWANPFIFPSMVFETLDEGVDIGGYHAAGLGDVADAIGRSMEILPEIAPTFGRLGIKAEEANQAVSELFQGRPELLKQVATDPEAWAAFIGNGLPSLYAAWASGGSIPFMAWLEAMDQAENAAEFEKRTGQKISDEEFIASTAVVGAVNAFLEKAGLDAILGKTEVGKRLVKKAGVAGAFLAGLVGEGSTELLQELTQNVAGLIYDPDLRADAADAIQEGEWEPFLKQMSEGLLPAAMGGAGLGGLAGTIRSGAERLNERIRESAEREASGYTEREAEEAGLIKVPVTLDLFARMRDGEPLTADEQYTLTSEGFAKYIDPANDDRLMLLPAGRRKRAELEEAGGVESITLEGDQVTTTIEPIESVEIGNDPIVEVRDDVEDHATVRVGDRRPRRTIRAMLDRAAKRAHPQPTEAQIEAGNYRKGHVRFQGLELSIENPRGSVRSGTDRAGKKWKRTLKSHYGYIRGTVGRDKDHIDVFIGKHPTSDRVYVINQNDPQSGKFDEHKVMLGYRTQEEAKAAYLENYEKGWKGLGSITAMTMPEFKQWLASGKTKQPVTQDIHEFQRSVRERFPQLEDFLLHESTSGTVVLSFIEVKRGKRKEGVGSEVMRELIDWADANDRTIELSVAERNRETGTTSKRRLMSFYRRFGFVPNKGRTKRFDISMYSTMWRPPGGRPRRALANLVDRGVPTEVRGAEPVAIESLDLPPAEGREVARKRFAAQAAKGVVEMTDGREVRLGMTGYRKVRSHSADVRLLDVLANIRKILGAAEHLSTTDARREGSGDALRFIHRYGAKVALNGREHMVELIVREDVSGQNVFYDASIAQLHPTMTANFMRWFGQSKVVDEAGRPLVVYHGTPGPAFDQFDPNRKGVTTFFGIPVETQRHGFFFAENAEFARGFADQPRARGQGTVMPVYLKIERPLVLPSDSPPYWKDIKALVEQGIDRDWLERKAGDPRTSWEMFDGEDGAFFVEAVKAAGFDGVLFQEEGVGLDPDAPPQDVWVAFEPEQIKSAIGNAGTFDPENPSILRSQRATNAGKGMTRAEVQNAVRSVYRGFRNVPPVRVVESFEDLPQHLRRGFYDDRARIAGVYDQEALTEDIYLIANNIDSAEEAVEVLLHEIVGHYGLRQVVDFEVYDDVMDMIHASFTREVMEVARVQGLDLSDPTERRIAAEEFIAYSAQKLLRKQSIPEKVVVAIRRLVDSLKALLARIFRGEDRYTEAQLWALIAEAHNYVSRPAGFARDKRRGHKRALASENPPYYYSQMWEVISKDPARARTPDDWVKIIRGHVNNGRLKEEEVAWSGIEEWLQGATWRYLVSLRQDLISKLPKHVRDAYERDYEIERKYNEVQRRFSEMFRGTSSVEQFITYNRPMEFSSEADRDLFERRVAALREEEPKIKQELEDLKQQLTEARDAWREIMQQKPDKIPTEFVMAYIAEHGVQIEISENVVDVSDAPQFDERWPDEEEFDDDYSEDDKLDEFSEFISTKWDDREFHSDYLNPAYEAHNYNPALEDEEQDEDWDGTSEEDIREEAEAEYREYLEGEYWDDFSTKYDEEHTTYRWSLSFGDGDSGIDVYRQGPEGNFDVYAYNGSYIGSFSHASEVQEAINEEYMEGAEGQKRWQDYTLPGGDDYREWLFKWENAPSGVHFKEEAHWGESENFVAHARFDTRQNMEGKDVLFVDELQSDWHQSIRDNGVLDPELSKREAKLYWKEVDAYAANERRKILEQMLAWPIDKAVLEELLGHHFPAGGTPHRNRAIDLLNQASKLFTQRDDKIQDAIEAETMYTINIVHRRHNYSRFLDWQANLDAGFDGTPHETMLREAREMARTRVESGTTESYRATVPPDDLQNLNWAEIVEWLDDKDDRLTELGSEGHEVVPSAHNGIVRLAVVFSALVESLKAAAAAAQGNEELADRYSGWLPRIDLTAADDLRLQANKRMLDMSEHLARSVRAKEGIDPAPFAKTWQLLAIKALLREAIAKGHDSLFIAPGEVHGVRWRSATSAEAVEWERADVEVDEIGPDGAVIVDVNNMPKKKKVDGVAIWPARITVGDPDVMGVDAPHLPLFQPTSNYRLSEVPLELPLKKIHTGVGADVAAEIMKAIANGQTRGTVEAEAVGRSFIQVANVDRDTMLGSREIYNVITPNIVNKWLKRFGTEMKLGVVKLGSTDPERMEAHGVKIVWPDKEQHQRRRIDDDPDGLPAYNIRRVHPSELPYTSGDSLYGAYDREGKLDRSSVHNDPLQVQRWIDHQMRKYLVQFAGFEAFEIKITDKLREAGKKGFPLFMKKYPSKPLQDSLDWAEKNIGPRGPSSVRRLQEFVLRIVRQQAKLAKIEQALIDQFAGIKWAIRQVYGKDLPAEMSGYKQAHFTTGLDSQMYAFLTYGLPVWKDGITQIKPGSKGLLEILEPVANRIDEWGYWMAARRAQRLMKDGREHLFTPEVIKGLLELEIYHPEFIEVAEAYAQWKTEFLNWAEEAGVINSETRPLWDHADYVPFFRLKADELGFSFSRKAATGAAGIANQFSPIRRLKGGKDPLGNILENIIVNFTQIASTAMKNRAATLTIENLEGSGLIEPVKGSEWMQKEWIAEADLKKKLKAAGIDPAGLDPLALHAMRRMWTIQPPSGDDIISVLVNGKKKYYHVKEETLFRAMTAINQTAFNSFLGRALMWPFRSAKRLLTSMITLHPGFLAANWMRDVPSSFVNSRHAKFPRLDQSVVGVKKALMKNVEMVNMMAAGGAFYTGYINALDPAATTKGLRRAMRRRGYKNRILDAPWKFFELYTDLAAAAENGNRIAHAYIPAIKSGASVAEAVWEAKDIMNFAKHGDHIIVQFLAQSVPFLNARIQGLVRFGQRFPEAPGLTFAKGFVMVTLPTIALLLMYMDDERYKELPEEEKDLYWHFWHGDKHYRIPKPFEVGALLGTIPERLIEWWYSNEDDAGKLALARIKFVIAEMFNLFNPKTIFPLPALIEPFHEASTNWDNFLQAPIVPEYMQDIAQVAPELTYDQFTSVSMRELARLMPDFAPKMLRNPMLLEHLILGYTGTIGSQVMAWTDDLVRKQFDYPPRPELRWSQIPVIGRFYRGDDPPTRTRYEEVLYEVRNAARAINRAITQMEREELFDEIEAFREAPSSYYSKFSNQEVLDAGEALESSARALQRIRREMNEIWLDRSLSPEAKLRQLNDLYRQKADEARDAYGLRPGGGAGGVQIGIEALIDNIRGLQPDEAVEFLQAQGMHSTAELVASLPVEPRQGFAAILRNNA